MFSEKESCFANEFSAFFLPELSFSALVRATVPVSEQGGTVFERFFP